MEKIYHSRQIIGELVNYIQILNYQEKILIYRVGDTLRDRLSIPKSILPEKIKDVKNISTKPEFETLFIINEGLYDEYLKVKSTTSPSSFYKKHNKKYKKQKQFVYDYFSKMSCNEIKNLINLYVQKHGKSIDKNHYSLLELIK